MPGGALSARDYIPREGHFESKTRPSLPKCAGLSKMDDGGNEHRVGHDKTIRHTLAESWSLQSYRRVRVQTVAVFAARLSRR
jgi:hypothetical protein